MVNEKEGMSCAVEETEHLDSAVLPQVPVRIVSLIRTHAKYRFAGSIDYLKRSIASKFRNNCVRRHDQLVDY